MAPTSYQAPHKGDADHNQTYSQSTGSAMSSQQSTVGDILSGKGQDVIAVRPGDSIADVATLLSGKKIGAVVVRDQTGAMVGILSERDIVNQLAKTPGSTLSLQAQDLMTTGIQTCAPSEILTAILKRMTEGRFRHLPVMEDDQLIGLVSIGDVVKHRLIELEYEALKMKQMIVG